MEPIQYLANTEKGYYIVEQLPKDIKYRRLALYMGFEEGKEIYLPRKHFYVYGVPVYIKGKSIFVKNNLAYRILVRKI